MFWAGRSPIYFMKCHNNGWTEVKAGKNPLAIEKAKEKWIRFAYTTFRDQPHNKDILNFCAYVKKIFAQDTGRVHFLILPVNGPVRQYQDYVIRSSHLVSILKQEFPQSLLIDANSTYQLSDCRTFEYSHLDSKNAAEFSFKIGEMIRDSLLTNGARNN